MNQCRETRTDDSKRNTIKNQHQESEHKQGPTSGIGIGARTKTKNRNSSVNQRKEMAQKHEPLPSIGTEARTNTRNKTKTNTGRPR